PTDVSSSTLATTVANQTAKGFTGITISKVTSYIVTCPVSGAASTRQTTALTSAPDNTANVYNLEVVVQSQLQPLLPRNNGFMKIPGLNAAVPAQARADVFFENTQGLTQ
ncbi:MAG: hypothetical protein ACRD3W_18975, partial [Terriglobales bacterium]